MEEALEQTVQISSHRAFWGVLKVPLASEPIKRKFSCNLALVGQNVHSGHIKFYVSFSFFFKNNR